jgi:alpha-ketoglutarate-dependent taurine dioxygenase
MSPAPSFDRFRSGKRKTVRLSEEELTRTGFLDDQRLPLVVEPNLPGVNLVSWAAAHREAIGAHLARHGAVLFRGFGVDAVNELEDFTRATSGDALHYTERSSPRSQVQGKVYTSTDHPASQTIFLHNEQSYSLTFPLRILFSCAIAAETGGETPIADCRKVLARLDPEVVERFARLGYLYVRNFGDGFGLSWQEAFQTSDRSRVEEYCRSRDIEVEWKDGDRLRTRQRRRALGIHPRTGDRVWFNHLTFFHVTTLEEPVRSELLGAFAEEDLPNNTYYGDGSTIEPEVLEQLRDAYHQETVVFPWQVGDVLLLDNMSTAHGRRPFTGARKVVVSMADPYDWADVESVNG